MVGKGGRGTQSCFICSLSLFFLATLALNYVSPRQHSLRVNSILASHYSKNFSDDSANFNPSRMKHP